MNKSLFTILLFVTLIVSCKMGSEEVEISTSYLNCQDTLLIQEIATNDLLFGRSYIISDSVADYIGIWEGSSTQKDFALINKPMKEQSIPIDDFQKCNSLDLSCWSSARSKYFISDDLVNVIFRDTYITSGKVDNYEVLRYMTGRDGLMYISKIYYSNDKNDAIVGVSFHCGWKCGTTGVRHYQFYGSSWKLATNYVTSES